MKLIKVLCIICSMLVLYGCGTQKHNFKVSGEVLSVSDDYIMLGVNQSSCEGIDGVYAVNVLLDELKDYDNLSIGDIIEVTFENSIDSEPITLIDVSSIQTIQESNIDSITDNTLKPGFACATALELIYEDELYSYYFECIKSKYIVVNFTDGTSLNIKEALEKEKISIQELDIFGIEYIIEEK